MIDHPTAVCILPMTDDDPEFRGYTVEDLQQKYFLKSLASHGRFLFPKRAPAAEKDTLVLFQWKAQVVARAVLLVKAKRYDSLHGEEFNGIVGEYAGEMVFDRSTIMVFDPVNKEAVKRHWPNFKGFTRMQYLSPPQNYIAFESNELKNIRTPQVWLANDEAETFDTTDTENYSPDGIDRRSLVYKQICKRRGQRAFRDALRKRYGDLCLVTKCEVLDVVEAAHISPYRGENDNHVQNGLLLRSDIHTLFDLDLLGINPDSLRVEVHPNIQCEYSHLSGAMLMCTSDAKPSHEALQQRYQKFRERLGGTA
ncbi:MAG: HNH endonuclease [Bythopirellula sp.]|nr:HNH endonuclease [Bythopirellula sp.]